MRKLPHLPGNLPGMVNGYLPHLPAPLRGASSAASRPGGGILPEVRSASAHTPFPLGGHLPPC
jgi:hypothetical protein